MTRYFSCCSLRPQTTQKLLAAGYANCTKVGSNEKNQHSFPRAVRCPLFYECVPILFSQREISQARCCLAIKPNRAPQKEATPLHTTSNGLPSHPDRQERKKVRTCD